MCVCVYALCICMHVSVCSGVCVVYEYVGHTVGGGCLGSSSCACGGGGCECARIRVKVRCNLEKWNVLAEG